MNIKELLYPEIHIEDHALFKKSMVTHNLERSKSLAIIVIILEIILSIIDIVTALLRVNNSFHFDQYLIMYILMILANVMLLSYIKRIGKVEYYSTSSIRKIEYSIMAYMIFMLSWGSIITLMDQRLYGQAMTFVINLSICSIIYYIDNKDMLFVYIVPLLILFFGLPLFQSSSNILIGHYVNISIFTVLAFVASRILYNSFLSNFKSNRLLENVNSELKELTFVDDLTKIPNRRNFNAYIDLKYTYNTKGKPLISMIMIDIDCFKQYNDNYGHMAGDEIIMAVAQQIYSTVRHTHDFVARIGGDEFVFISENTGEDEILKIADRIITSVASLKIPHEHSPVSGYVTLSLGTCTTKVNSKEDIFKCLENADKALYGTKARGRNGVTSFLACRSEKEIS